MSSFQYLYLWLHHPKLQFCLVYHSVCCVGRQQIVSISVCTFTKYTPYGKQKKINIYLLMHSYGSLVIHVNLWWHKHKFNLCGSVIIIAWRKNMIFTTMWLPC